MTIDLFDGLTVVIWFILCQLQLWYLRSKVLKLRDRIHELELDTRALRQDRKETK